MCSKFNIYVKLFVKVRAVRHQCRQFIVCKSLIICLLTCESKSNVASMESVLGVSNINIYV